MKAVFSSTFLPLFVFCVLSSQVWAIQSKGAIIIASMEGEVSVTNNETGVALSSDRVKVGGLIFDGHTVSTGPASKAVLLFSSGTITTLKADSVLNIKKFAQEKFDPKAAGKLGDRKDEPSPSETVIDLNLGDMVVDVKKLKKESSFNIDSPVGTAGIRGTVPAIQVIKLPDGGFTQNTSMLRGEIAFTPRAGGPATFLGPGQSLSIGIGANGLMLPAMLGRVDPSVMKSIAAEVDKAAAASGVTPAESEPAGDTPQGASEEDAPSEDQLNESDDERQASAKGLDDNGTEAVALEKAGLIDLDDPAQIAQVETYVEVTQKGAEIFDQIIVESDSINSGQRQGRRVLSPDEIEDAISQINLANSLSEIDDILESANGQHPELYSAARSKKRQIFSSNIGKNLGNVVEVTEQAEELNLKNEDNLAGFINNSEQSGDLVEVLRDADEIGAKNAENMSSVFSNPDKASDLKTVVKAAKDAFTESPTAENGDGTSSQGSVSEDGKETMSAVFRAAENATEVADTVKAADEEKRKAEAAAKLAAEEAAAKNLAAQKFEETISQIEEAPNQEMVDDLISNFESDHSAEYRTGLDFSEAVEQKKSEFEAQRIAEELAAASEAEKAALESELAAAEEANRQAAEAAAAAKLIAAAKKAALLDYEEVISAISEAKTVDAVDKLVLGFTSKHDAGARDGLDLSSKAKEKSTAILKGSNKVLGVLKVVKKVDENKQEAKKVEARRLAVEAAAEDYNKKQEAIKSATDAETIDSILAEFISGHSEDARKGLDLSGNAEAKREAILAEQQKAAAEAEAARLAAELAAASEAEKAALEAELAAAEEARVQAAAEAEAKAAAEAEAQRIAAELAAAAAAEKELVDEFRTSVGTKENLEDLKGLFLENLSDEINTDLKDEIFKAKTDTKVSSLLAGAGFSESSELTSKVLARWEVVYPKKEEINALNAFNQIDAVAELTANAIEMEQKAAEEAAVVAAVLDYEEKLQEIKNAQDLETIANLISKFEASHDSLARDGLDLSGNAEPKRQSILADLAKAEAEAEALRIVAELAAASEAEKAALEAELIAAEDARQKAEAAAAAKAAEEAVAQAAAEAEAAEKALAAEQDAARIAAEQEAAASGFESVVENAEQAGELKEMVDRAELLKEQKEAEAAAKEAERLAAEQEALRLAEELAKASEAEKAELEFQLAKAEADKAAAEAAKEAAEKSAKNSSNVSGLLNNADKAKDLKSMADKTEELKKLADEEAAKAEAERLAAENAQAEAAAEAQRLAEEIANASEEDKLALEVELAVAEDARQAAEVAKQEAEAAKAAAEATAEKTSDVSSLFENVEQAADLAAVVKTAEDGGANLSDILANPDQATELKKVVDKTEEIKAAREAEKLAAEQEAQRLADELAEASEADKAELQAQLDAAEAAKAAAEAAAENTSNLLQTVVSNADKANSLSEVVTSAADEGVDVTNLLENADQAESLVKAKRAADQVAAAKEAERLAADQKAKAAEEEAARLAAELAQASEAQKAEIEAQLVEAEAAKSAAEEARAKAEADKKAAKKEALESVAANAANAEDVATVLEAAQGQDAETVAALLRNAEQAQSMAKSIKEAEAIEQDAASLEVDAATRTAIDDAIENIKASLSISGVDQILSSFQDNNPEVELPESLTKLAESRKKNLSLIKVVKQVDDNKQEAKAIAEKAEAERTAAEEEAQRLAEELANASAAEKEALQAQVDAANAAKETLDIYRNQVTALEDIDELRDLFKVSLPDEITSDDLKGKIFKAKTEEKVLDLIADVSEESSDQVVNFWKITFPKKEEINALNAFNSIDTLAEVASKTAVTNQVIEVAEGTTQETINRINEARDLLEEAESLEDVDEILASLTAEAIEIPEGLISLAASQRKSINLLNAVLEDAESANVVATLIESSENSGFGTSFLDDLGEDGEEIDLGQVLSNAAVNSLVGDPTDRFKNEDLIFAESDVEGEKILSLQGYDNFSLSSERAGDLLALLDSPALRLENATSPGLSAEQATAIQSQNEQKKLSRDALFRNIDKLDNLREILGILDGDAVKVQLVFDNLLNLDALLPLTKQIKYEDAKLDVLYGQLGSETQDLETKEMTLFYFSELTNRFIGDAKKLDAVYANPEKLETIADLTSREDFSLEQQTLLFNNLDYSDEILRVSNGYEGQKRTTILASMKKLSSAFSDQPARRRLVFQNPSQVVALEALYDEFKNDATKMSVIFSNAAQANAFLDVLDELKGDSGTGNFQQLFDDPPATMENIGLAKLKADYDSRYHFIFDENKERAAEISATASKFKNDPEKLELVFNNIDKLKDIENFINEFESIELDQSGNDIVVRDGARIDIFFSNIENLDDLLEFKRLASDAGLTGGESLDLFDADPEFLELVRTNKKFLGTMKKVFGNLVIVDGDEVDTIISADLAIQLGSAGTNKSTLQALANPEYNYFDILEDEANLGQVDQISKVASKFVGDLEQFDLVMSNLDKLEDIEIFFGEFGAINSKDDNGNDIVFRDEARLEIFFANLENLDDLKEFKALSSEVGLSGGESLDLYDVEQAFLELARSDKEFIGVMKDVFGNLVKQDGESTDTVISYELASQLSVAGINRRVLEVLSDPQNNYLVILEDEQNLLNAGRISKTASNFVENSDQLSKVMSNLDKLEDIEIFFGEFGAINTKDDNGNDIVIRDEARLGIFFAEINDLDSLLSYKALAEQNEVPAGFALDVYSDQKDFLLDVINHFRDVTTDDQGLEIIVYDQSRVSVIFENLNDLESLKDFTDLSRQYEVPLASAFDSYASGKSFIEKFIRKFESVVEDENGNEILALDLSRVAILFQFLDRLKDLEQFSDFADANNIPFASAIDTFAIEHVYLTETINRFSRDETDESGIPTRVYDEERIAILFASLDHLEQLKEFTFFTDQTNVIPLDFAFDLYSKDSGYLDLAQKDIEFLVLLYDGPVSVLNIPSSVASELQTIGLSKDELYQVVQDLNTGPVSDGPSTSPPSDEGINENSVNFKTLSFLKDHDLIDSINPELVFSTEIAFASSFFSEILDTYDALSALEENPYDYFPSDQDVYDSLDDAISQNQGDNGVQNNLGSETFHSTGVLGGRRISFGAGQYDLSLLSFENLTVASSESISLTGDIIFNYGQNQVRNELILLSAGGINFEPGSSIQFFGESLGFGSFESMEVIDVDLYADDELSARSLDTLVIQNVEMATSGNGSDFVHLLAYNELAVDNLRFSEQIKQITMEAMTINLYNLNFPNGSMVKLNSQYGAMDGKYPNFNSSILGRVNFVDNIRYSSNLIMDRASFDDFGTNISIGKIGN